MRLEQSDSIQSVPVTHSLFAPSRFGRASGYLLALAGSIVAVAIAALAQGVFGLSDLSPIFMLAVIAIAAHTRTGPALVAAMLCFLGYNYFFFEPRYTLYVSTPEGVATIILFLAAALLAGRLASRLAMQVQVLRDTNRHVRLRQELGQRLAVAADEEQVLRASCDFFRDHFGADTHFVFTGSAPNQPPASQHEQSFPLRTPMIDLGHVRLRFRETQPEFDAGEPSQLQPMIDDLALALERVRLVADLQSVRVANETERFRNALLSSVSHDLRTPLAAILGAAESLENYSDVLSDADRRELLATVGEEGRRLNRHIQNLLDMTRLGHGELELKRDWIGVDELIGSAIGRLQRYSPGVRFSVSVAGDIGPIWVHPALVEQALFNVIENAARFSPPGEAISIVARTEETTRLCIDIHDCGPGIPPQDRLRIFEMFFSVDRGDRGRNNTGLGLAICRGMIGAHGGTVAAMPNEPGAGTTIRITLPLLKPDRAGAAA